MTFKQSTLRQQHFAVYLYRFLQTRAELTRLGDFELNAESRVNRVLLPSSVALLWAATRLQARNKNAGNARLLNSHLNKIDSYERRLITLPGDGNEKTLAQLASKSETPGRHHLFSRESC